MPAPSYEKGDGTTVWVRIIDFASKEEYACFQTLTKAALDPASSSCLRPAITMRLSLEGSSNRGTESTTARHNAEAHARQGPTLEGGSCREHCISRSYTAGGTRHWLVSSSLRS